MSDFAEKMLNPEPWQGQLMGNYALVRAMLESGVMVATTYPGSPTPEIADAIRALPKERRRMYFEYSTNEKVALEVAFGAAMNGHPSTVFFKSVGLNVAADSAVQLPLLNIPGGLVVVLGDDPGANSSQNEQDNRHFARTSYMPMFEPATPTEAYIFFKEAMRLSRKHSTAVFLRMTTHVCHAREEISFDTLPQGEFDWSQKFDECTGNYMPLTAAVFPLKRSAFAKLDLFEKEAESDLLNPIMLPQGAEPDRKRLGVIVSAMPALSLLENMFDGGGAIDILKLGLSYPWPKEKTERFLRDHDEVLIIEELDRILEHEIKSFAFDMGLKCRIHARRDRKDLMGELTPPRTWKLLSEVRPVEYPPRQMNKQTVSVPPRVPQMCPGCGHRSAFHAIKGALDQSAITVADIGCHTLGYFAPYELGRILLCMGHSTGTAAGMSLGDGKRKVVCFLGDSTFFHAGIPGIVNAILHDHNITLIVMENGTTAMTGHQPHAASPEQGENKIPVQRVLEGLGVKFIRNVDTYRQAELAQAVREAVDHVGFSVVIARHPCMLQFVRTRLRKGAFQTVQVEIDPEICDKSQVCVKEFGCPSFVLAEDGSVSVHKDLCIGDGSCKQVCPVSAIVQKKREG